MAEILFFKYLGSHIWKERGRAPHTSKTDSDTNTHECRRMGVPYCSHYATESIVRQKMDGDGMYTLIRVCSSLERSEMSERKIVADALVLCKQRAIRGKVRTSTFMVKSFVD